MRAAQDGLLPDGRLGALVVWQGQAARADRLQWLPMIAGIPAESAQFWRGSDLVKCTPCTKKTCSISELGDDPHIVHRPVRGDRGKIIAAYSVAVLKSGERSREVMWVRK